MLKKSVVILSIVGTILGGIAVVDYFSDSIDIKETVIQKIVKEDAEEDIYTDSNSYNFKPMRIEGSLKEGSYYPGERTKAKFLIGNDLIVFYVPSSEIKTNYSDTVYDPLGSYYIAVSNDSKRKQSKKINITEHYLGRGEPFVFEIQPPNSKSVIYIQCYSEESLGFFKTYDWDKMFGHKKVKKYNFLMNDDDLAKTISIPKSIIPKKSKMKLDPEYSQIVMYNMDSNSSPLDFNSFFELNFTYYRAVGFLDTHIKIEYAKLISMGYKPVEYGIYDNITYIKFKELTLLGYSLTKNSCLIYHVSNS